MNDERRERAAFSSNGEDRWPLHDCDAEAGALACVLLANKQAEAVKLFGQLDETDFYDERHKTIFRALTSLETDNEIINSVSLYERLKQDDSLTDAGGTEYVASLPDKSPSSANFPIFFEKAREFADRRTELADCEKRQRAAYDLSIPFNRKRKSTLPAIEDAAAFASVQMPEPQQLISGILHRGCKLALGGGSKTFKTWNLLDLALSISHGEPWLSKKTTRARVCYVNLELPPWGLQSRLLAVAAAKQIRIGAGWLHVWNLRGHANSYEQLLPALGNELKNSEFGLLILDPIYKLYGDADENSARDVSALLNEFERLAQQTGAAIAFASHFSKGNQAGKEAVDRISGSGVFARDPDAILTFTRHEEDGAFVVDSTLRNCGAIEPFVVRWLYPLMRRDDGLDATKLKQPHKGGRPTAYSPDDILAALGKRKLTSAQWLAKATENTGIGRTAFFGVVRQLNKAGKVEKSKTDKWAVCKGSSESPITT